MTHEEIFIVHFAQRCHYMCNNYECCNSPHDIHDPFSRMALCVYYVTPQVAMPLPVMMVRWLR